jgi:hypothetical protein
VALVVVGVAGYMAVNPPRPLLESAGFSSARITPNADGSDDVAVFTYRLGRNASITLVFQAQDGREFVFRDGQRRAAGEYSVQFSGVVDAFSLPDDDWPDGLRLERRLLPDGPYTWTLTALADDGERQTQSGSLAIVQGDPDLPIISAFEVGPTVFAPNQDGIRDRINVNVYLTKPAQLTVYLENADGGRIYLSERKGGRDPGEAGNHEFDYDGGVDQGFRPPPDGVYDLFAVAQDDEGQRMVRQSQITIEDSGLPQVEIVPQVTGASVCFEAGAYDPAYFSDSSALGQPIPQPQTICSERTTLSIPQSDLLIFRLTVYNYGDTPIRTAGPFPGTVYEDTQRASSLGEYEESGAWRVGIMCDTSESDFPWRWALAPLEELTLVEDASGQTYYYLQPGQRAETWGAIRMTQRIEARNPQPCWAGLIHEDVGIPAQQNNVGRREVEVVAP